jgi:hypothetical protein
MYPLLRTEPGSMIQNFAGTLRLSLSSAGSSPTSSCGEILVIGSNTKADLILGGGKITWSVPFSWRDHLEFDRWEIIEHHSIIIIPRDNPNECPKLQLSNWECKGYYFGRAILDQNGWVKAVTEGGVYCYTEGGESELKVMTNAERLWNIIPAG